MSLFIDSINEKFKNSNLMDVHIEELFEKHPCYNNDQIYLIFERYLVNSNEFNISNVEIILIEEELKKDLDPLISISLCYLLLYSDKDVKQEFINNLKKYIDTYFENIDSENEYLYFENFYFLMELVCNYSNIKQDYKIKKGVAKIIYIRIMNNSKESINSILLVNKLMNDESTFCFFEISDYIKINERYLDIVPNNKNIYVYLRLYYEYINCLKRNNRQKELNKSQRNYVKFVIMNEDLIKNKLYILLE